MTASRSPVDSAYGAWKEADARARDLEAQVTQSWAAFEEGDAGVPRADLMERLIEARKAASHKVEELLREMQRQRRAER